MNYFLGFKSRFCNVKIIPIHGGCTDPLSIIKFAIKQSRENEINLNSGDGVWCVFDVDENTNKELKQADIMARKRKIRITLSNPCIEIWFLMHYQLPTPYHDREELKKELREKLPTYEERGTKVTLDPLLADAIMNAKELNKRHQANGIELYSRESNPSSQVYELIDFIKSVIEKNRND